VDKLENGDVGVIGRAILEWKINENNRESISSTL
jgi:hypothetical protein